MTKIPRVGNTLIEAAGILISAKPAFALIGASAAAFVPFGPGDVNYITHDTTRVWNTDANGSHYVVANMGMVSFSAGNHTWTVQVSTVNAASLTCYATAIRQDGFGTVYQNSFSFVIPPVTHYPVTITVNIQTAGKYGVTYTCLLPPAGPGMVLEGVTD